MPLPIDRRRFLGGLAAASLAASGTVRASEFPTRPVTLVLPYAPGGSADVLGRVFAQEMQADLGQSVVIDNRAGAGTVIGATSVARAAPDGYTLLMSSGTTVTVNPAVRAKLP